MVMDALSAAKQQMIAVSNWIRDRVSPVAAKSFPVELGSWRKEFDLIRNQIEHPETVRIALIGSTGAGKSTFLNAVLGQEVLPVGVMQPCTAFVTLVRQSPNPGYTLEVEFCSRAEWQKEVESFAAYLRPGDSESIAGDVESKRLVDAARKRVGAVFGESAVQGIDPDVLLGLPLPKEAEAIFSSDPAQQYRFESAQDMLQQLRKLIRGESTLWPLVKQVSISGPYECLAGGLELVDLPGLNDPNAARVEVTREFLRTSPFVWVLFPMVRGLTQDIQTILGEERLLRTLVFAGTYSSLSLIGTKADDVDTNIAPQLGLSEDCETVDLIREYCRQTKVEAREQLVQMIRDMAGPDDSSDTLERMLDMARNISVHATSASAYMKLKGIGRLRKDYGLVDLADTGVPEIHAHLARISREAGAELNAGMASRRLKQLASEIAFFFRTSAQGASPESENARRRIHEEQIKLVKAIESARTESRIRLEVHRQGFLDQVTPLLRNSVGGVRRVCDGWERIHWATLRAVVKHDGSFKSPSTGRYYDFNEDLTEPLMGQLPVAWERHFTDNLGRVADNYVISVTKEGIHFCESVRLIIDLVFHKKSELMEDQLRWFEDKIRLLSQAAQGRLLAAVTQRRGELASKIPLVARGYMLTAYMDARAESGGGMKGRILERIGSAAMLAAPPIYDTIQKDLLEGLSDLDAVILGLFEELSRAATAQAETVEKNAGIDIDEASIDPAVREILQSLPLAA